MGERFEPQGPLSGTLRPPPDKSISHRAALIAGMGSGASVLRGYLDAADTRSTLAAIRNVGADVTIAREGDGDCEVHVTGVGLRGATPASIDVGNAGTLLRLIAGWLAGQGAGEWRLDGDASIRRRPVDRIAEPLARMGARIDCLDGRLPPMTIAGSELHGIEYELPVASAQVKSCVLFAGLLGEGETKVIEPVATRDHTERMLTAAGARIQRGSDGIVVSPADGLEPGDYTVPGDFSSAAFWVAAALIVPGSEIVIKGVGLNPTRTALMEILRRMGADIEAGSETDAGGEPTGTVRVRHSELRATTVEGAEVPNAIDELPLVALVACFADGETTIREAGELRRKESDRVETVAAALRAIGVHVETLPDGLIVQGRGRVPGGAVQSRGDHRIAMLGAIAGLASENGVAVDGMEAAGVSYPTFERDLGALLGKG